MYADLTKDSYMKRKMIKMTKKADPAKQLNANLKYEVDQANDLIDTQKKIIVDLTTRLIKVTDVVDEINKAKYRSRIQKYVDPKKVTNNELNSMDVNDLQQMDETFKLLKTQVAGIDFDVPDTRPSILTVPSRFKFGNKPTD